MKRFVHVFLVLVALSALVFYAGCSGKKVLRIGTNAEYPPFEFKENNEFKGIDMELAQLLAQRMQMEYEIIDMDFDALIPSIAAGKIDLALSAITITEERKNQVDFSVPYYLANQAIIAPEDKEIMFDNPDSLIHYVIGVQNGTTGQLYIDDQFVKTEKMPKDQLKKYPTNIEAITDMLNGNVDLVIIDDSAAKGYMQLKPIKIIHVIETGENYGIAMQKGSAYQAPVNEHLTEILNSDQWLELIKKYF